MLIRCWLVSLTVLLVVACSPPRGVYHTVQKGQTLYQIARTYQVDPKRISQINRVADPTRLAIGDRLFIPGATRVRAVRPTATASSAPREAQTATALPARPAPVAIKPPLKHPASPPEIRKPAVTRKAPDRGGLKPAKKGAFQWPVSGEVIKSFGAHPQSATGNGIEIATRLNTRVKSAAAGKVIYSGNGIPGYGNLIIVQHDDALYSVYGFNRKNLVEAGTFVSQGQDIALSGTPPAGGVPRLYFEARSGKNPVNPIFYLP